MPRFALSQRNDKRVTIWQGLAEIAEDVSLRRHAEISPVTDKETPHEW